ncbi:DEAD/DEAH box helicase [Rhodothermus marinus]|uniref:DEAD/DEAH box helicase n=1 Tax=Rhodothermus marinus TaxID=29549 RepID=UPI000B2589F8|nr:DEAD/DEAH box helicase [Rhodothermus marinus]
MSDAAADRYETARALLRRYWRHDDFRPGQWEIIQAVLQGQDVLAVLPTGTGKSVCYQLPALLLDGLTLVVSPLLALIEDQVARLRARGIPAAFLHGHLSTHAAEQCWIDAEHGAYRLLYVTPEQLTTARFEARAGRLRVAVLAVDEAHCVSEWGPQFRPAYLHLPEARRQLGDPPLLALTATATPRVRQDIVEKLALRTPPDHRARLRPAQSGLVRVRNRRQSRTRPGRTPGRARSGHPVLRHAAKRRTLD